ncbi:MAG: hypothetical protein M3Q89_05915, partial [Verrucomicrobiota bacterium]|nr:hypothetical protein [Verrucomicrobiota bacterium]
VNELNRLVKSTAQFQRAEAAEKLIRMPTGDGMALAFFSSPKAPVKCALEISEALRGNSPLKLRMGIHSGPVSGITDVNERSNLAGAGINIAQRVMDCGDAGHILLSKRIADDLGQYGRWRDHLYDLGEVETKHGAKIEVVNLYTEDLGNPEVPETLRRAKGQAARATAASDASARREEGFWIAVLPVKYVGANADLTALAEGLGEEIVTGLSRFSYLKVIARSSTSRYVNESVDVRSAGKELGARYVMEGSLRQAGATLRLAVQLVDASTGAHLWAETYERTFRPEEIFALQDDLVPRIVSTVADWYGILPRSNERSSPEQRRRPTEPIRSGPAQLRLLRAHDRGGTRRGAGRS